MRSLLAQRPTIAQLWGACKQLPGGRRIFSRTIGRMAPYTGTIDCEVEELRAGFAQVAMRDRKAVRNHLESVHAIALMNLGEVATGLAVLIGVDGRGRGIIKHLAMDYLSKARGRITATCEVAVPERPGSYDVEAEALLRDEQGAIVARARAIWKIDIDA